MSNNASPKNSDEIVKKSITSGFKVGNTMNESSGSFSMVGSPKNGVLIDGKQYQRDKEGNFYVMERKEF
jgi:hypothetical protein